MILSMNKNMYTMNAAEFLFKYNSNMFEKHIENILDEQEIRASILDKKVNDDDCEKDDIVFGEEQFQNILSNKYDTFETTPFDTEDEWFIIKTENAEPNNDEVYNDIDEDNSDDEGILVIE